MFIEEIVISIKQKLLPMRKQALLIVDDHPVYRDALGEKFCHEFAKWQLPVKLASGTHEGLSVLNDSNDYEWVVVLDILLQGLSGEEAIQLFQAQASVKHVIAISGLDENEWRKRALRSGASAFISKNNVSQFICDQVKELMNMNPEHATLSLIHI